MLVIVKYNTWLLVKPFTYNGALIEIKVSFSGLGPGLSETVSKDIEL